MSKLLKNLPVLPAERALKIISGRWKAVVLYQLFEGPKRLSELRRLLPAASEKILVQQLRELEAHGLVHREVHRQVPPRVDYSATALGLSLAPIFQALCDWGRHHAAELDELDRLAPCAVEVDERRAVEAPLTRVTAVRRKPARPRKALEPA